MPGNPGGLWRWDQGPLSPTKVLGEAEDGGKDGRVPRCTLPQRERGYPGQPTVSHHLKCGVRCGGLPLGIPAGGGTQGTGGGQGKQRGRRRDTDGGEDDPGPR